MKNNAPVFWPGDNASATLKQQIDKNYTDCINILQTQWYQADLDQRFSMGDQDLWGLIFPGVSTYRRKIFNFNIINSLQQMVTGDQRANRKATIAVPLTNAVQKTADQLTKCLYHVHGNNLYNVYSDTFEQGAWVQGIGLTGFYRDLSNDPISGDIRGRYIDFKSILIDPYFREPTLSDCRFIWTRQFFGREELSALYPQFKDDILSIPTGSYRDDKFYYMPEVYQIQFPNVVAFDEYWYLSERNAMYLVDKETEECQEYTGNEEKLKDIMRAFRNRLAIVEKPKRTVKRTLLLNDQVLVDEDDPNKIDRYPFAACLGYFNPDTPYYAYKFRGGVRDLRDAQYLVNRRKVADLDYIESQQQGLKVKKGALVTPDDSLNQGNGRVLTIDKNYQMDDVQQMQVRGPDPTLLQMEDMLMQIMYRISGISQEAAGHDIDDKAGIITMLRQAASKVSQGKILDNFDMYQRQCGEIITGMIQTHWTYGKVKQVINEEPTPEFDDKAFLKYGCKVIQGALTETQQQLQLQQLLYFRETTGIPIPSKVILEAATLQNKDKLIEAVMAEEKAAQEQAQKREQLELKQIQVDNETKMAYAHSQHGLAEERLAKIELDKALNAERMQRAEEDKAGAILDVVQAIKTLQEIDLNNLEKYLNIVDRVENKVSGESIPNNSESKNGIQRR